ncbi:MAG: SHOCT domain-containing protein [Candidatus Saccharibacteria bacterium]|nr:SHOCT domain-containing protein [Microbacteriaceae bacterium]
MMWGNYGMSGWSWFFGGLVVIGVVILIIVLLRRSTPVRSDTPSTPPTVAGSAPSPKQILDERYARGELSTEEYRVRLSTLGLNP